ncbi:clarin-3 [Hemiscyllium ocellatum]|uniref:clarin-3 n=1 Tax=Hemiscyllium ocellatum TaxID=170820 RepID=UPI00296636B5|nr:clarin-3 [Hemiscyllium ocellatum]
MPSLRKKLMFLGGFSVSLVTCMLISAILAMDSWVDTAVTCENKSGDAVGEMNLKYGLFDGQREKSGCPIFIPDGSIKVLECFKNANTARAIHILVILFIVFGLLFSLLSAIVTLYNSISNPYENICGPVGVYTCSSISCVSTFLAMVLFAVNTSVNNLSTVLISNSIQEGLATFRLKVDNYDYSFWLILLSLALNVTTIGIVYAYQHANYTREREQKRPMEIAPKDVLMY